MRNGSRRKSRHHYRRWNGNREGDGNSLCEGRARRSSLLAAVRTPCKKRQTRSRRPAVAQKLSSPMWPSPVKCSGFLPKPKKLCGRIDILFNNAGVFITGREAQDYTEEEWHRIFQVNFWGTFYGMKYIVPYLKKSGGGAIINCSSVSGRVAQRMQAPYNTSKAAVEMMSKCMSLELGPSKIRINTICPNMTETDMAAPALAKKGRATYEESYPLPPPRPAARHR